MKLYEENELKVTFEKTLTIGKIDKNFFMDVYSKMGLVPMIRVIRYAYPEMDLVVAKELAQELVYRK